MPESQKNLVGDTGFEQGAPSGEGSGIGADGRTSGGPARAYCSCVHVAYVPEELPGGMKRERWLCPDCRTRFVRSGAADEMKRQRDGAYHERNQLVAALSAVFPSWRMQHIPVPGEPWDPEWVNVVGIQLPTGQCTWHIHVDEMPLFAHLYPSDVPWDGHTTEQKYERIAAFVRESRP